MVKRALLCRALPVGLLALLGCAGHGPGALGAGSSVPPVASPSIKALDEGARRWVEETLAGLSLREAAAQLVIPWISGAYASNDDADFEELLSWVDAGIGGVSISIGGPDAYVQKLNRLQLRARVPLLVTSDFESGGPGMRINHSYAVPSMLAQGGGTSFPPTMAFGATGDEGLVFDFGRATAAEARAVGVHWVFAPVVDVNSNPDNPVIGTRAFGEDPLRVGRLGAAFIRGLRAGGALSTAKHFPGHGDARTDSHVGLPIISANRERLDTTEFVPFRMAIEAGVDAVMTAHVAMPEVLKGHEPATLAPLFMTDVLRGEMGFEGLLFTDALRMGAITLGYGGGEAAVLSLEAGSDVLLAPESVLETVESVSRAVETGRLSRERLDRSVRRVLEAKATLGLHRDRLASPSAVHAKVGSASHRKLARRAAEAAITLVRDEEGSVPGAFSPGSRILSVTYARPSDLLAGRSFDRTLSESAGELLRRRVDEGTGRARYDALIREARRADAVVVGAYAAPAEGSYPAPFAGFLRRLQGAAPWALISFGSPYLLRAAPEAPAYVAAWGGREGPQEAAARALSGRIPIGGRMPVSIPALHPLGAGLDREALPEALSIAQERIDPLREAGFASPRESDAGDAEEPEEQEPAGGPGRWRGGGDSYPRCENDPYEHSLPRDFSGEFCWEGEALVSPREIYQGYLGMDPGLDEVDGLILDAIRDSVSPGAALAVVRRGRLARLRGYGRLDWDQDAPLVTPASIFDLASLTKVVGTTSAIMVLEGDGALDLFDPVVTRLPEWELGDPRKADVLIRDLLYHDGGLPPFRRFFLEMEGREAYRDAINRLPLDQPARQATVYSDIGLMTLGFLAEEASGQSLDELLAKRVFEPLGMADTGFRPAPSLWDRVATTEVDELYRGVHVHGVVHDENAHAMGGVAGHAGLFSSARDLAVFVDLMLNRGTVPPCEADFRSGTPCHAARHEPVTVFSPLQVAEMTRASLTRALGWDVPSGRSSAGDYFSERSFGHTGYTGTSIWMDPVLDLGVVLLTARVNPTRENTRHVELRRAVHDAIALSVVDTPPARRKN